MIIPPWQRPPQWRGRFRSLEVVILLAALAHFTMFSTSSASPVLCQSAPEVCLQMCPMTEFRCDASNQPGLYTDLNPNITKLALVAGDITTWPSGTFRHYPKLEHLVLTRHFISRLNTGAFDGLSALLSLDLSGNPITIIDSDVFNPLVNLATLDLTSIAVTKYMPDTFVKLTKLTSLEVRCLDCP